MSDTEPTITTPSVAATFIADFLSEMEEARHVDAWLTAIALAEARKADQGGKITALLQALADRFEDAQGMYHARAVARKLVKMQGRTSDATREARA